MTDASARLPTFDVYVAASWRTPRQQEVVAVLRAAGLKVYDFRNPAPDDDGFSWRELDPDWQTWTPDQFIAGLTHPIARKGFEQDMAALRGSRLVVLVQPSGRSAALEFGWSKGFGKPGAVLLAEGQEPELMLSMADLLTSSLDAIVAWALRAGIPEGAPEPYGGVLRRLEAVLAMNRQDDSCVVPRSLLMELRAGILWAQLGVAPPQGSAPPSALRQIALRIADRLDDALLSASPPESARDAELTRLLEGAADTLRGLVGLRPQGEAPQ